MGVGVDSITGELKDKVLELNGVLSGEALTKLLLPVEPEVTDDDDELRYECNPEGDGRHWAALESLLKVPCRSVGEDTARANAIRGGSSRNHDADTSNDLRKRKRGANV